MNWFLFPSFLIFHFIFQGGVSTRELWYCETIYPLESGKVSVPPLKHQEAIKKVFLWYFFAIWWENELHHKNTISFKLGQLTIRGTGEIFSSHESGWGKISMQTWIRWSIHPSPTYGRIMIKKAKVVLLCWFEINHSICLFFLWQCSFLRISIESVRKKVLKWRSATPCTSNCMICFLYIFWRKWIFIESVM